MLGGAWIVLAALLWATDALVRVRSLAALSPTFVVWAEHVMILVLLGASLPIFWRTAPRSVRQFRLRDTKLLLLTLLVGAGGSALGTVLFTAAFQSTHPSVVILLQKLQPIFVILLARTFLGEKPKTGFYFWSGIALLAALVLQFTENGNFELPSFQGIEHSTTARGSALAVGAAFIWAVSTVAGRQLLLKRSVLATTSWRFFWGGVALSAALAAIPSERAQFAGAWSALWSDPQLFASVAYMSIGPGLIAMGAYYMGLAQVTASRVTVLELIFPVCAVVLNTLFLNAHLSWPQWIAGAVLVGAVSRIET